MSKDIAVRALNAKGGQVNIPIGDILKIHHLNERPKAHSVPTLLKETLKGLKRIGSDFAYAVIGTPRGLEQVLIPVLDARILTNKLK